MSQKRLCRQWFGLIVLWFCGVGIAVAGTPTSIDSLASTITGSLGGIVKLITAGAYVGGIGFALGAVMKFKQHKDNPTQIPIGTPISLIFIAAALLFFPTVLTITGKSIFGDAKTPGTAGTVWGAK